MSVQILQGDCRELLAEMPGKSVHAVVTSPPYWGLRDYGTAPLSWPALAYSPLLGLPACVEVPAMQACLGLEPTLEAFIGHMVLVFREVHRVLRDDGTCWVNMGDSYATGTKPKDLVGQPWRLALALQADGWWLRQDIIWHKPNPMPESTKDRCTKSHEYLFLLAKSERYYWDFAAMQEQASDGTKPRRAGPNAMRGQGSNRPEGSGRANREGRDMAKAGWKMPDGWDTGKGAHGSFHREGRENGRKLAEAGSGPKNNDSFDAAMAVMPLTRNKRSVWTVGTEPFKEAHFATFPSTLIEPCIKASCPEGGLILDPFGGAGTTGLVADRLGRNAVLCELNPEYIAIAERRLAGDFGHVARQISMEEAA